jgi:hypothetical protein
VSETRDPGRAQWAEAERATALGDKVLPDPEAVRLAEFRDATLLVLAVVAHAHGATAREIRRATGQLPFAPVPISGSRRGMGSGSGSRRT